MSSGPSTRILDHIVHLVPPGTLPQAVQTFRDLGFTYVDTLLQITKVPITDRSVLQ